MKYRADGREGVRPRPPLDDTMAEDLIAGRTAADTGDLALVSAFLHDLRALGQGRPSPPSAALARMLAGDPESGTDGFRRPLNGDDRGLSTPPGASKGHRRPPPAQVGATGRARPSARVVGRAALIALAATAGVSGAAAARLLPAPVQDAVARAIEAITPFQVSASTGDDDAGEALSRQDGVFDPGDGHHPLAPAGEPDGHSYHGPAHVPAAGGGTGDRTARRPSMNGDPSEEGDAARPGPAVGGGATGAPSPAPAPGAAPETTPADGGREPAPAPPPGGRTYTATLSGAADPARPGDPDGSGRGSVTLHPGRNLLCVTLTTSGIGPVTNVHLHRASPSSTPPIVATTAPAADGSPDCLAVGKDVLRRIRRDPAGHYLEVHNPEFPDGALRGRLSR